MGEYSDTIFHTDARFSLTYFSRRRGQNKYSEFLYIVIWGILRAGDSMDRECAACKPCSRHEESHSSCSRVSVAQGRSKTRQIISQDENDTSIMGAHSMPPPWAPASWTVYCTLSHACTGSIADTTVYYSVLCLQGVRPQAETHAPKQK